MPKNPDTDPVNHQQAEGVPELTIGRDQILKRLWELASLNPEATRSSMAGQIKAIAMIVAIEGLIPDRRASAARAQSTPPPAPAQIYKAKWLREQQQQSEGASQTPEPEPPPLPAAGTPSPNLNPFIQPEPLSRVPEADNYTFDTVLNATRSLRLPLSLRKGLPPRGR